MVAILLSDPVSRGVSLLDFVNLVVAFSVISFHLLSDFRSRLSRGSFSVVIVPVSLILSISASAAIHRLDAFFLNKISQLPD